MFVPKSAIHLLLSLAFISGVFSGCNAAVITTDEAPIDDDGINSPVDNNTPNEPTVPQAQTAEEFFTSDVSPILSGNCAGCHTAGAENFLANEPTVREKILAYNSGSLIDLSAPDNSRLATFPSDPAHPGPSLNDTQADTVITWIAAEAGTPIPTE